MKQYVIDELQRPEQRKLEDYFKRYLHPSGVDGIYWLFLDEDLLSDTQRSHRECRPYYIAVDLTDTAMHCELLVRAKNRLRCDCIAYVDRRQREWVIDLIDAIVAKLAIQA